MSVSVVCKIIKSQLHEFFVVSGWPILWSWIYFYNNRTILGHFNLLPNAIHELNGRWGKILSIIIRICVKYPRIFSNCGLRNFQKIKSYNILAWIRLQYAEEVWIAHLNIAYVISINICVLRESGGIRLGYVTLCTVNSPAQLAWTSTSNYELICSYNSTSTCVPRYYWDKLYRIVSG